MRCIWVGILCVWISGCASVGISSVGANADTEIVKKSQSVAVQEQELELYIFPQSPTEEAYVLRMEY